MPDNRQSITCIIPFYNEGKRILKVLDTITKIPELTDIICVDDGSTDNAAGFIKTNFPKIKLVRLASNRGKSGAVSAGLPYVKTEYVFLCDADLIEINGDKLSTDFDLISRGSYFDMIIFKTLPNLGLLTLMGKFTRGDVIISGQRILKKEDLKNIFKIESPVRYQLEMAINRYMLRNDKKSYWMGNFAFIPHKTQKVGFIKGWRNDIVMYKQFLNRGLFDWLKIVLTFCKEKYKPAIV